MRHFFTTRRGHYTSWELIPGVAAHMAYKAHQLIDPSAVNHCGLRIIWCSPAPAPAGSGSVQTRQRGVQIIGMTEKPAIKTSAPGPGE